jgi:2-haloacid dehalogenase
MAVRALVFDVFGTLVDWRSGVAEAFRASGVSGDPEELADSWPARYWPILAEVNDGTRPWGNFDDLRLVTLDALLAERGMELPVEERRRLVGAWHRLDPWPDVRTGLEALRRQRVTAAFSNGQRRDRRPTKIYELRDNRALLPPPGTADRGLVYQWSLFAYTSRRA